MPKERESPAHEQAGTAAPGSQRTAPIPSIWLGIGRGTSFDRALIYLDHNATTPVLPEVLEAMQPWLSSHWGNPSSIHGPGRLARRAIEEARSKLAALVGAAPEQIVFASGATEANNAGIHSALLRNPTKRHVVTSSVEHSAVLAYCDHLERYHAVEVTRLPVDEDGMLSASDLESAIRPDTAIVSLMWANNETGVIWPVAEFAKFCEAKGVPFHTDAVQAVGKVPVDFRSSGASFLSLSGHKFGAPKGIGALVVADPDSFVPMIVGGKQEHGHRGGTENVPHIVGLGAAAEIVRNRGLDAWVKVAKLRDDFERSILEGIIGSQVNGGNGLRLPNTSNIHIPGSDGDALVTFLDQQGICVSSGSACLESAITPSHVILAMSGSHDRASESIRVSLGWEATATDIKRLLKALETFSAVNT
jgi:cysteine desulfurase